MRRAPYIKMTEREYQKDFRKRFKKLKKELYEFRLGCAYLPKNAFLEIQKAFSSFNKAHEECKRWWRKS